VHPADGEALRRQALEELGPLAPALAHDALTAAGITIDADVLAWEGSLGTVHAHRVFLALDEALLLGVRAAPAVVDALTAAVAAALSRTPRVALAELVFTLRAGNEASGGQTAYRGRL